MDTSVLEMEAEEIADGVLVRFEVKTLPVCPRAIASAAGIVVQTRTTTDQGVSGFLMRVGDEFGIYYASHIQNEGFIRFSIAHELGHYFLPGHAEALFAEGKQVHESRGNFVSENRYERQADLFAAALLMPRRLFLEVMRSLAPGFPAIRELKGLCQTSITAAAIRYARFAEDPVAVVVSSGNKVEYSFLSECLDDFSGIRRIRKGSPLPPATCTAKFNADPKNVSGCREDGAFTSLDDWFDGAPQVEMKEDVVGLGRYGKTLTVLFSEDALDDEADDTEID